jgi:zinc protease
MEEVAALSRADAQDWYHAWYGPENAILVVAGDITAEELKPLAEQIYGAVPRSGGLKSRWRFVVDPLEAPVEVRHADPKVRQTAWSRTWLGVAIGDADAEALQVGMQILGGGRSSRLYSELVEHGKAVMVYGYSYEMESSGLLSFSVSPAPGVSIEDGKKAALGVADRLLREGPTEQELARAKRVIAASSIHRRDNQQRLAEWYAVQLVAGQSLESIETWDDRIQAVTAEQVKAALNKYLTRPGYVDAVLLPERK